MNHHSLQLRSLSAIVLLTFLLGACSPGQASTSTSLMVEVPAPLAQGPSDPVQAQPEQPAPIPPAPAVPTPAPPSPTVPDPPPPVPAPPTIPTPPPLPLVKVVDGYVDRSSYAPGDTQTVYLNASAAISGTVQLTNMTGQVVAELNADVRPQAPTTTNPYAEGFGYAPSFQFQIPHLSSGVYFWAGQVPFIVRDPELTLPITVLVDTNTINAYNCAGGLGFYHCTDGSPLVPSVSFQRPQPFKSAFSFPFLEWISQQGMNVRYIADSDLDDPAILKGTRLLIVAGHSEYWSGEARQTFDAYVRQGGNAAVFSGNTLWWKVRYSADGHNLICYKQGTDPVQDTESTGRWESTRFHAPIVSSMGSTFSAGGYLNVNADSGYTVLHPESPVFRNTLSAASTTFMSIGSLGNRFEMDGLAGYVPGVTSDQVVAQQLGADRAEVLAYVPTVGVLTTPVSNTFSTMVLVQKHPGEGVVFNASLNGWAKQLSPSAPAHDTYARITQNVIQMLSEGQDPF